MRYRYLLLCLVLGLLVQFPPAGAAAAAALAQPAFAGLLAGLYLHHRHANRTATATPAGGAR